METLRERHFPNTSRSLGIVLDSRAELVRSLTKLIRGIPPTKPWSNSFLSGRSGGLFTGPTSIALLFFHLSRSHPDLQICDECPIYWCSEYLTCASPPPLADFHHGGCGTSNEFLAYHTLTAVYENDQKSAMSVINALQDMKSIDPELNEWMKGRAGALYFLRFLGTYMPALRPVLTPVQQSIVAHLLASQPWKFREKRYLGAVHGDIGIITQAVLTDPASAPKFEATLTSLLQDQLEDGNWLSREAQGSSLVQFCHGAPGFVVSLLVLKPYFPDLGQKIDDAVARARQCIWSQGLLTKEPNLCHGATGNALALEDAQMEHFLSESTPEKISLGVKKGLYEMSYDSWGLLWGEAGRAWSWAVLDSRRNGQHVLRGVISYTEV